jgi:hypothetical protein
MKKISIIFLIIIVMGLSAFAVEYPGKEPAKAVLVIDSKTITLQNNVLKQSWKITNNKIVSEKLSDIAGNTNIDLSVSELFTLIVEGKVQNTSAFKVLTAPEEYLLIPNKSSGRFSQGLSGKAVRASLVSPDGKLNVQWTAILRDGSNYVQQQFVFSTTQPDLNVSEYYFEFLIPGKADAGAVDGSPATFGNYFFASENPMTKTTLSQKGKTDLLHFGLPRYGGLTKDEPFTVTITTGVVPKNQMRRGFLYYLERERAHPYVQYLHYNSWFDISYS